MEEEKVIKSTNTNTTIPCYGCEHMHTPERIKMFRCVCDCHDEIKKDDLENKKSLSGDSSVNEEEYIWEWKYVRGSD